MIHGGKFRLGVLGGIGPEATGEFYNRLINALQQSGLIKGNRDYPQIVVNSVPAPELVGKISEDELDSKLATYKEGLKQLDNFGVDMIVMACNTIHLYHGILQDGIKTHIRNLRYDVYTEMCATMPMDLKQSIRYKVTVLGTTSTIQSGLYKFPEFEYIELTGQDLKVLNDAILKYNRGDNKIAQQRVTKDIAEKYLKMGAEKIIVACTEPSVMLKDFDIPKIDTLDVLVDRVVRAAKNRDNL